VSRVCNVTMCVFVSIHTYLHTHTLARAHTRIICIYSRTYVPSPRVLSSPFNSSLYCCHLLSPPPTTIAAFFLFIETSYYSLSLWLYVSLFLMLLMGFYAPLLLLPSLSIHSLPPSLQLSLANETNCINVLLLCLPLYHLPLLFLPRATVCVHRSCRRKTMQPNSRSTHSVFIRVFLHTLRISCWFVASASACLPLSLSPPPLSPCYVHSLPLFLHLPICVSSCSLLFLPAYRRPRIKYQLANTTRVVI
jgi:hypothetical protein